MRRSRRRASSIVAARASMTARACSATTLGRSPPSMNPTFSVNPRSWSRSAPTAWICAASSSIALAPRVGSMPAWAAMPCTRSSNSPQPLRPVLTAPPGSAGSSTKTASARRASSSIRLRDERLPRSSSAVHNITTRRSDNRPAEASARTASMPMTMPAFMSNTPGPCKRPSDSRSGMRSSWPTGQTVSKCPSSMTCRAGGPEPKVARRCAPLVGEGIRSTAPPISRRCSASRAPQRSTAAGSVVGDSRPTSSVSTPISQS